MKHDIRQGVLAFVTRVPAERRAIFLDRDGTLIDELHYARDPDRIRLRAGAVEAIAELRSRGFALVVISNQSGVGRGILTVADVESTHRRMAHLLAEAGVRIDAAYYCLHSPEAGCDCRKPGIGMLLRARDELNLRLEQSVMIGDKESDLESGRRAGCRVIPADADWTRFPSTSEASCSENP